MARSFADETVETSTTTGVGDYTLAGPKGYYFPFSTSFATGDKPVYAVRNKQNTKVEYNRGGAYTAGAPATLARSVWKSTNGNAPVNWTTDDHPLTIYIPASAELQEGVVTGWLAAARHALLRAGSWWMDSAAGIGTSWIHKLATGNSTDVRAGYYDVVKDAYFQDNRRRFLDNGAANLVMTAAHIGQTIKFDVTAAGLIFTLPAGAGAGIGPGFPIYVLPYGGNNCVSLVPDAAQRIDGGSVGVAVPVPAGRITAIWWDDLAAAWKTDLALTPLHPPGGRLTLQSGESVHSADYTGKTTVYYTPHIVGGMVPIRAGAGFSMFPFSERSNDLTASSTGKAGPAAAGPYQVIDVFIWSDGGTIRSTRGPKWKKSAPFTVTIATPGVVTQAGHGLYDGATWRATATTGALPTGMALNTDYFVTKIDANTFKLSTTLANQIAGTFISTSGSQSGTHTGENYTTDRGTGAGSTELDTVMGVKVNKYDITNGPAAGQGTYVGSIYTNGSSQVDFKTGSVAANGGEAVIGVWNVYNRVAIRTAVGDSTPSWNYSTTTVRAANGSATARVSFLCGLLEDSVSATYTAAAGSAGSTVAAGVGLDSVSAFSGIYPWASPLSSAYAPAIGNHSARVLGFHYFAALEYFSVGSATTWLGAQTGCQTGLSHSGVY